MTTTDARRRDLRRMGYHMLILPVVLLVILVAALLVEGRQVAPPLGDRCPQCGAMLTEHGRPQGEARLAQLRVWAARQLQAAQEEGAGAITERARLRWATRAEMLRRFAGLLDEEGP